MTEAKEPGAPRRRKPAKSHVRLVADNTPDRRDVAKSGKGGRPAFVPTASDRMLVKLMYFVGYTEEQMRKQIPVPGKIEPGIALNTFKAAFAKERAEGAAAIELAIANSLFQKAIGTGQGSVTAAIFLAKARLRWDDRPDQDAPGDDEDDNGEVVVGLDMRTA